MSLIPERHIVLSPKLAATIGLEEAVLLQVISDSLQWLSNHGFRDSEGITWFPLTLLQLENQTPFWQADKRQQVLNQLSEQGIIILRDSYLALNQSTQAAKARPKATGTKPATQQSNTSPSQTAVQNQRQLSATSHVTLIPENWQPDEDLLKLLQMNHSIPVHFSLEQLEDFKLYWIERGERFHAWDNKFRQHVLKNWQRKQQLHTAPQQNWQPSQDAMEILLRAGIDKGFIMEAVPEFVLYWRERGQESTTWNSKFIAHIRRQWAKYQQTVIPDYEPSAIPDNWQPNEDVYDILAMANIDKPFAQQQLAEFVLFWKDTKEIHRSWNSKFLQHVKYQWASRHHWQQQGKNHAGQSNTARSAKQQASTFEKLTDRGWANDILNKPK